MIENEILLRIGYFLICFVALLALCALYFFLESLRALK